MAQNSGDEVVNESVPAVESAVVSDEAAESDVQENTEDNESDAPEIGDAPESAPAEGNGTPESAPAHHEGVITTIDPVDSRITYTYSTNADGKPFTRHWSGSDEDREESLKLLGYNESNEASLEYLEEFFGTDSLLVDEQFKGGIERELVYGQFVCDVTEGAKAYSPVEGRVIAASPEPRYNGGLGAFVAVDLTIRSLS